ncbi:unnamed protein product [Adineta ricciae]|uniref:Uncharacterized protein n=1 Tax=Adineta ricciae TaxID=249248 RepID=A0A815NTF5_ADIRI|nr:unnamed protein product [Adineta ricciae]
MVETQFRTITITDISETSLDEIDPKDDKFLPCPCSNTSIVYKKFVSHHITYHPVCLSYFITQQWIKALNSPNASRYIPGDFRMIAHSQFQLLADFCSRIKEMISQAEAEIGNYELITVDLLSKKQLESKVNTTVESVRNSTSIRLMSYVDYINTTTQSNNYISALNTNTKIITELHPMKKYIAKKYASYYVLKQSIHGAPCGGPDVFMEAVFYATQSPADLKRTLVTAYDLPSNKPIIGFSAACTPFEGFLRSTLDCLSDEECIQLLIEYIPSITQTNFNSTNSILSSTQQNLSLYDHLEDLFIDHWSIDTNYSEYFRQCAALSCSYTTKDKKNIYYALTILISLYGGFTTILRFFIPYFINMMFNLKSQSTNNNMTIIVRLRKYGRSLQQLNLYKTAADRTANSIKQQQIMTRVYIILLIGSFMILLLFHTLNTENVTITERNPSFDTYNNLKVLYTDTLKCPCSAMTIPYREFLELSPIMHQVCHSDFVSERWISSVSVFRGTPGVYDWYNHARSHFQLLSDLCRLANKTIDDTVNQLLLQQFAVSNVLNKTIFDAQINEVLNQSFQSAMTSFRVIVKITSLFTQVDQLYMGWSQNGGGFDDANLFVDHLENKTINKTSLNLTFKLIEIHDTKSSLVNCICATNPYCQHIYYLRRDRLSSEIYFNDHYSLNASGFTRRCSDVDSLLFSTLECFYVDSDCLTILLKNIYSHSRLRYSPLFQPLVYNSTISHFPPNTLIKSIVEELMIEEWNPSLFYEKFYQSCVPKYCTYLKRTRTKDTLQIIIALISIIGGVSISIRIIALYLVKTIVFLNGLTTKNQRKPKAKPNDNVTVHRNCFDRLVMIIRSLSTLLYTQLNNLKIFSPRDFDSRIDRITAKRLGQWSTRLYIILFITGLVILSLYTIIRPESQTKIFYEPSFARYNHLVEKYRNQLKCFCSSIASKHNEFVILEPQFHQICSSPFASDQWRINITSGLVRDLLPYPRTDYRRFFSAHLQFLHGLCDLSLELINNSVHQFHTSFFITTQLLSKTEFNQRLDSSIEQIQSNTPKAFTQLLVLIRKINHADAVISTYGTNYEYIIPWNTINEVYAPTQSITYDNCSCDLDLNCTSQAMFHSKSERIPIKGLKIGCTPSESFLQSTLECFYDQSCLKLIEGYINTTHSSIPLSTTMNNFSTNRTVLQLVSNLFVEEFLPAIDYSVYFERCKPSYCSYTYIQKFNVLYVVTLVIALQGGLSIFLKWISPNIIQITLNIYYYYQKQRRRNIIQSSSSSNEMISTMSVNASVENTLSQSESIPRNVSIRCTFKLIIIICILMICVITSLVLFSIYFPRQGNDQKHSITNVTTETSSSLPIIESICKMKFEMIPTNISNTLPILPVIADFNNDHQLDLAFYYVRKQHLYVLLGTGRGTFQQELFFPIGNINPSIPIVAADFNNDHQVDLIFANSNRKRIYILFGYGNGSFQPLETVSLLMEQAPTSIAVADFNNDNYIDIGVLPSFEWETTFFFGIGNGTFSRHIHRSPGLSLPNLKFIDTADLNRDGFEDILVWDDGPDSRISLLLGSGTKLNDFNNDTLPDLAVSCIHKIFKIEKPMNPFKIATADFNCDGYLDIVFSEFDPFRIQILVGSKYGNYHLEEVFTEQLNSTYIWIDVGDFNGDNYPDIIALDQSFGFIFVLLNTNKCCLHKH